MTNDAVMVLRGLEELYPEMPFVERLRHTIETYPHMNFQDMMSRGQIRSKQWVIHELLMNGFDSLGRVMVCGGWYGMMSRMILDHPKIHAHYVESVDIDEHATIIAGEFNSEYISEGTMLPVLADCRQMFCEEFDTVINTSCEHFVRFDWWWNKVDKGQLVILQSNNFREIDDHVNCVDSEDELADMAYMSEVHFKGSMQTHKYTRYMVIGTK